MKNGFSKVVDKILRSYGLKTRDCVGTVWAYGNKSRNALLALGYKVERGIDNPDYDYVIISKGKSTIPNILKALTKIKIGTIIIFRVDNVMIGALVDLANIAGATLSFHYYGNNNKLLGVLFKGKDF